MKELGPRILVIGCSGAGKSTFSVKLGEKTGLPVVHLDRLLWKPGWVMSERAEFDAKLDAELCKDKWIMDGNYDRSLPRRLERATDVFAFDFSMYFCFYRVLKRIATTYGRTRPDLGLDCPEKIDFEFFKWIWKFPKDVWAPTLQILDQKKNTVRIHFFRKTKDVDKALEAVQNLEIK